ncbi:MAG: transcriptional regulator [Candidatus Glassbacteria bacterium]|nr:transcriptional regulator [Candidatus Glassbacteria bacterium]
MTQNQTAQTETDWHPADIKAALAKRGWSYARISREFGHKDLSTAYGVLKKPYPRIERFIAEIIGIPPHRIWPTRYFKDGSPKGLGIRGEYSKSPHLGNGKSRGAA